MANKTPGQELLENAYQLATPKDNATYYDALAPEYDGTFAERLGYTYAEEVARSYLATATQEDVPVADIGCGTGLVALGLKLPASAVDGMDISDAMLAIARSKSLYRALYNVDLTGSLDSISNDYGAVLSAGTFTHGHLGPEPLRALLAIARTGGLFVIGINEVHFAKQDFRSAFADMAREGLISEPVIDRRKMYSKSGHDHSDDHALIVNYRKR
jgi:predicted TPR repeat methyltransferase